MRNEMIECAWAHNINRDGCSSSFILGGFSYFGGSHFPLREGVGLMFCMLCGRLSRVGGSAGRARASLPGKHGISVISSRKSRAGYAVVHQPVGAAHASNLLQCSFFGLPGTPPPGPAFLYSNSGVVVVPVPILFMFPRRDDCRTSWLGACVLFPFIRLDRARRARSWPG